MTTEATENPQVPQPPVMEVAEVFRILGRLEQAQQGTREQLTEIKELLARHEERNDQRFDLQDQRFDRQEERNDAQNRETSRRIDRLWYAIVGGAIAILAGFAGLAVQNALLA